MVDHGKGHEYDLLTEVGAKELERIQSLVDEAKTKAQGQESVDRDDVYLHIAVLSSFEIEPDLIWLLFVKEPIGPVVVARVSRVTGIFSDLHLFSIGQ